MAEEICNKCRWDNGSYHCMDCKSYDGDLDELEPFCGYCNHTTGSHSCNNCVWNGVLNKNFTKGEKNVK